MRKQILLGLLGFLGFLVSPISAQTTEMETQYKALAERFPTRDKQQYKRFTVELPDHGMDIVFYKSLRSDRWWMEVPCDDSERLERYKRHTLIPCHYSDYQRAMENEIPELWWHYYNRMNG